MRKFTLGLSKRLGMPTVTRNFSDSKVRRSIYQILEDNRLCAMSTVTKKGEAHINIGYFAFTKRGRLELYYLSYPDSLHSKNLNSNSTMGIAIFDSKQEWLGKDRGLQLLGTCAEARGSQCKKAESVYSSRYSKYPRWKKEFARERNGIFPMRLYRFLPKSGKLLDERVEEFHDSLVLVSL
jgi:uncharacterized protein YhbP (UPF0306 family)